MQSMLVLHQDGKLFSNMTLFKTFGLEGLTHITLGIKSVPTNISHHISTLTAFAFVGTQRSPMQRIEVLLLFYLQRNCQNSRESCLKVYKLF